MRNNEGGVTLSNAPRILLHNLVISDGYVENVLLRRGILLLVICGWKWHTSQHELVYIGKDIGNISIVNFSDHYLLFGVYADYDTDVH